MRLQEAEVLNRLAHRRELLAAFGNDEDDLAANAAGRLGRGQAVRLRRGAARSLLTMVAVVAAVGALVLATATRPIAPWRWGLIAVAGAAGLAAGVHRALQLRAAVVDGRVRRLTGPVSTTLRPRTGWWLGVDGQTFHLPVRFWHVGAGLEYDVHIAPAAALVVAMVPAPVAAVAPIRAWAERLCTIESDETATVLAALDPHAAAVSVQESRGRFFMLVVTLPPSSVTRADVEATLGPGVALPRVHHDSPLRVAHRVGPAGTPWTVDVFVVLAHPDDEHAVAIELRRQRAA